MTPNLNIIVWAPFKLMVAQLTLSAYGMYVGYGNNITKLDYGDKNYGFSVRCVKD